MKFPTTPDELKSEILISSDLAHKLDDLRLRQLIKILDKVDHDIIVEGIIKVFEISDRPNLFQDQEFAGKNFRGYQSKIKERSK